MNNNVKLMGIYCKLPHYFPSILSSLNLSIKCSFEQNLLDNIASNFDLKKIQIKITVKTNILSNTQLHYNLSFEFLVYCFNSQ